ncbi:MAG TPA: histidine triad nucleotide-binding protein [Acidimicrobiia bacterium]|nr:histidine triad nucleotide-binding protein [Acidimicrobiia bacterium]
MSDCLFCRIVAGEIPSDRVAETDQVLAFRDINPAAPQHILLIPKDHVAESLAELEDINVLAELVKLAQEIATGPEFEEGWRLVTNVGDNGGQSVFHLHFHLLAGRRLGWPPG